MKNKQQEEIEEYQGSTECMLCHKECKNDLYDARRSGGSWAIMCKSCFDNFGLDTINAGLGRHFKRDKDGKFRRIKIPVYIKYC